MIKVLSISTICFIICLMFPSSIKSQETINLNELIINSNQVESFSGKLITEDKRLFFESNDCSLKSQKIDLKTFNDSRFNYNKWYKKVKSKKGTYKNILIKGVLHRDKLFIDVKKIDAPLLNPKIWSKGVSALYLDEAVNLYKKTIELREKYKVFSISIEEVEDSNLGNVTEYTIYDKDCNELGPEEIKKITSEELNTLNASINLGEELLVKQAILVELSEQSLAEIDQLTALKKIASSKDAATASLFQTAILTQLPKIIKNLRASKQYIERLRAE